MTAPPTDGRTPTRAGTPLLRAVLYLCAGGLLLLAVLPLSAAVGAGSDKLNHFLAFLVLAIALRGAFPTLRAIGAAGLCVAYGALIEIVQAFLTYRSAEWGDLAADTAGAVLGVAVMALVLRRA